jgi:hypothetical protein
VRRGPAGLWDPLHPFVKLAALAEAPGAEGAGDLHGEAPAEEGVAVAVAAADVRAPAGQLGAGAVRRREIDVRGNVARLGRGR